MPERLRIVIPSIVDPSISRGGAWTVTRGLIELFRRCPGNAELVVVVPPEPLSRHLHQLQSIAFAGWTGIPAKARFLRSLAFREQILSELDKTHCDLLVINGSDLLWCLEDAPRDIRTLAVVHNREAQLYAEQVATQIPDIPILRRYLLKDSKRLRQYELDGLRRASAAIFLSEWDARDLCSEISNLNHLLLPPLFAGTPSRVSKERSDRLDLGFLANFRWWPNREGLDWFVREILGRLPNDVRLHLFGEGSHDAVGVHPSIVPHGFVNDLRDVWRTCDWMVIPIRHGSGVSVKAAECIYNGMPIISTTFGMRGLPSIETDQIVRRETANDWVQFLSSAEARSLCKERLPISASHHFELEANVPRFLQFLSHLIT